jgi:predicted transport protein
MDHRAEFTLLAMRLLGSEIENSIDWSSPRSLCIAGDFTRYDEHAISQISRNTQLLRYRPYDDDYLVLELVNATGQESAPRPSDPFPKRPTRRTHHQPEWVRTRPLTRPSRTHHRRSKAFYESFEAFCLALGDDVQVVELKLYFAFKRIKNFVCVEVHSKELLAFLKVNPDQVDLMPGFTRDVRSIGHFGTGELEVGISTQEQLEQVKALIAQSYDASQSGSVAVPAIWRNSLPTTSAHPLNSPTIGSRRKRWAWQALLRAHQVE